VHEPSDTTPDLSNDTEAVTCENCGSSLSPMEWETLDNRETVNDAGNTGYGAALHFCSEECIAKWKASR
jgi:hypothetical protein